VKPPGYADRYTALQAEKPKRDDPRFAVPGWKKGLGFAAATLAGTFNPHVNAGELYHHILAGPYEQALGDWSEREGAIKQEAGLADTEAQMRQRDEAAELAKSKAAQPTKRQYENIQQLHADAVQDAIGRGVDPSKDPKVWQIEDSIQRIQKPTADKTPNDFEQFYKDYITDNHLPDSAHNRLMARQECCSALAVLCTSHGLSSGLLWRGPNHARHKKQKPRFQCRK